MPAEGPFFFYGNVEFNNSTGELPLSIDSNDIIVVGNILNEAKFKVIPAEGKNAYWIKSFASDQYVIKTDSGILMLGDSPHTWLIEVANDRYPDIFYLTDGEGDGIEFWTMDDLSGGQDIRAQGESSVKRKQRWKFKKADGPK